MRWAERIANHVEESSFGAALAQARSAGAELADLTVSNPTACGFQYDAATLLQALAQPASLRYRAEPMGSMRARTAVADLYYRPRGMAVGPDDLMLTASSSEAYGYLLRLLCNPGDAVAVPAPGYPLMDMLARMHDVEIVRYPLVYHDGWQIEPDGFRKAITSRCRAILTVNPNNPTGHYAGLQDRALLYEVAAQHGCAMISDEVFLDYPVQGNAGPSFWNPAAPSLTFVLSGLSKVLALPQMKLAWTAVCGSQAEVREAMERLEVIADTFLSVSAPVQEALPEWLPGQATMQDQLRARVGENLSVLDTLLAGQRLASRLRVEAGWCAVLRVPALEPDEVAAVRLMREAGVLVHPGSFYGFPHRGWLVVSLLPSTERFRAGVQRLLWWLTTEASII